MTMLTITTDDIKRLCAIPAADTDQDDDIGALITAEQAAHEYGLDPAVLSAAASDTGLSATLTLGVSERMAGSYLELSSRAAGVTDDFQIGPLHVSASRTENLGQLGQRLAVSGTRRLTPFGRASARVALDAVGDLPDPSTRAPGLASGPVTASVFDASLFDDPCREEG